LTHLFTVLITMRIFRICIFMRIFNIENDVSPQSRDCRTHLSPFSKGLMMSFINHTRDGQPQPAATPSLLAACIAMALMPAVSFAASATEDTVVVAGGFDNAQDPSGSQDTDYSVKTTTTGTKLLLVPRDIPQSVSVISQQRMADQNLQSLGQ